MSQIQDAKDEHHSHQFGKGTVQGLLKLVQELYKPNLLYHLQDNDTYRKIHNCKLCIECETYTVYIIIHVSHNTYLKHEEEEQPGMQVPSSSVDVRHLLEVCEGSLIAEEWGESISGSGHTADVQPYADNGHEGGQHFKPVPNVTEVRFTQFSYLEGDVNKVVDHYHEQDHL